MAVFTLTVVVAIAGGVRLIVDGGCINTCVVNRICGTDDGVGDGFVDGFGLIALVIFDGLILPGAVADVVRFVSSVLVVVLPAVVAGVVRVVLLVFIGCVASHGCWSG
jgi:hypothetical protein